MAISPEDRAKWDRQVAALRERETEKRSSPEVRAARIEEANKWRAAHGIAPLKERPEEIPPEVELHERAKRLGLLTRRG